MKSHHDSITKQIVDKVKTATHTVETACKSCGKKIMVSLPLEQKEPVNTKEFHCQTCEEEAIRRMQAFIKRTAPPPSKPNLEDPEIEEQSWEHKDRGSF